MLTKLAVRPLAAQMVVVATIAPRIAQQHAAATDAVAITAMMSVASQPVIVSLWLKLGSTFQLYEALKIQKQYDEPLCDLTIFI